VIKRRKNNTKRQHKRFMLQPIARFLCLGLNVLAAQTTSGQCLWTELSESGDTDFGRAVAIENQFVAVGDPVNAKVTIFRYNGVTWTQLQTLFPDNGSANSQFGQSAVMSENLLAIGDEKPFGNGSVSMYRYEDTTWTLEQIIFAQDVEAPQAEFFGRSIGLHDNELIVGNPNSGIQDPPISGTAYIVTKDDSQWTLETELTAPDNIVSNTFGIAVDIVGDTAVVSAGNIDKPNASPHSVFVYQRRNGTWSLQQQLSPFDTLAPIGYGIAVALDEEPSRLVVGAFQDLNQLGSLYVYQHNNTQWVFEQKLIASEVFGSFAFLGRSVAMDNSGSIVLSGAPGDWEAAFDAGAAHVFQHRPEQWIETAKFLPEIGTVFGDSVDLSGNHGIVGNPSDAGEHARIYTGLAKNDCNDNGVADACDILNGTSFDSNNNGVPNECDGVPDFDGSEVIDVDDLVLLLKAWGTADADTNQDGVTNVTDLLALLNAWGAVNPPPNCASNASCCETHAPGGCADQACCETICAQDAFCCDTAWDVLCVDAAKSTCAVCQ